jgi:hypothetical protein
MQLLRQRVWSWHYPYQQVVGEAAATFPGALFAANVSPE